MKFLNIDEDVSKISYIFIGLGKNKYAEINHHNYNLSKRIISSGFTNLFIQNDKINDFINGNMI